MPAFTLSRRQALIAIACALAAVLLASRYLATSRSASGSAPTASQTASVPPLSVPTTSTSAPPAGVVVDVAGAVRRPGLYTLASGSRIADAIARAGGETGRADPALINLAAPLADGEQVLVPRRVGVATDVGGASSGAGPPSPSAPVDLNTATVEQLDALPGIGPVTAQKIVDYRQQHGPFTSIDGLDAIPGIGPARIETLRGLVIA